MNNLSTINSEADFKEEKPCDTETLVKLEKKMSLQLDTAIQGLKLEIQDMELKKEALHVDLEQYEDEVLEKIESLQESLYQVESEYEQLHQPVYAKLVELEQLVARIESVSVGKIFPSTVKVIIEESIPQAIWFNNEKFYLIGRTGKVISNISENPISNEYILVFGDDAPQLYANIYYKLREHSLAKNLLALSSLQGRRWDLYLKDGLLIKLPEVDVEKALIILDKLNKNGMIINGGIDELDLRLLPEKIFVKRKK
jgi:hypothetical protein